MKKVIVGKNSDGYGLLGGLILFFIVVVIVIYVISFILMVLAAVGVSIGGFYSLKNYFKSFKKNVVDSYKEYTSVPEVIQ